VAEAALLHRAETISTPALLACARAKQVVRAMSSEPTMAWRCSSDTALESPAPRWCLTRSYAVRWGKSHQHRPLREACRRAGIDPPASFHILRHTYATHLLQGGAPLPVIAANLGHSDTRMTERHYAHLVPSHVAQVIRATMPKLGLVEPSQVMPLGQSATTAVQRLRIP